MEYELLKLEDQIHLTEKFISDIKDPIQKQALDKAQIKSIIYTGKIIKLIPNL